MKEQPSKPDQDGPSQYQPLRLDQLMLRRHMGSLHLQHHLLAVQMLSSWLEDRVPRPLSIALTLTRTSKRIATTLQCYPTQAMTLTPCLAGRGKYLTNSSVRFMMTRRMAMKRRKALKRRIGVNFLCARLAS